MSWIVRIGWELDWSKTSTLSELPSQQGKDSTTTSSGRGLSRPAGTESELQKIAFACHTLLRIPVISAARVPTESSSDMVRAR